MLIMNDKDLLELGLTAEGDRLKLQAFCNRRNNTKPEDREQKIARIKEILDQGRSKRGKKRTFDNTAKDDNDGGSKKKANFATLKFEFGWKHWRSGRGYVQQKKNTGGGTRAFNVPRLASLNDCKNIALNLFFPNGKSPVGNAVEMSIGMGNFNGEFIALDFTAERYKQVTGFPTPRLYLLTRHQDDEEASEEELMSRLLRKIGVLQAYQPHALLAKMMGFLKHAMDLMNISKEALPPILLLSLTKMKTGLVEHWLSIKNVLKQTYMYQPLLTLAKMTGLLERPPSVKNILKTWSGR